MTTLKVVPDNTGQDEREVKLWQGGMITGLVFGVPIGALPVAIVWMCVAYEVNAIQIVVLVALAIFFSILLPGGQRFWETVLGLILRPRGKR